MPFHIHMGGKTQIIEKRNVKRHPDFIELKSQFASAVTNMCSGCPQCVEEETKTLFKPLAALQGMII